MRTARWLLAGTCAAMLGAAVALAAASLKDWHKSEVSVLLSKDEEKAYKKLKDDPARQQWVDEFWKKLDPTPDAAPNEAQAAFEQRVALASKSLGEGGWKTDIGRTLLIFGPPASSKNETEGKGGKAGIAGADPGDAAGGPEYPVAVAQESDMDEEGGMMADGETAPSARRGPKTVLLWTYSDGNPGLGGNTELRFEGVAGKISLKTKGVELTRASFVASVPKQAAAPEPVADAAPAGGAEAGGQPAAAAQPADPAAAELLQILKEKKLSGDIALKADPYYFPSPDGNVYMPIALRPDYSRLPAAAGARAVHVFGAILQGETVVREFVLAHAGAAGTMLGKAEVIAPGAYDLLIGVRDDASGTYGLVQVPLQTPDFTQPSLSSILLSSTPPEQAEPVQGILNTVTEAVHLGPYKFQPYFGNEMKPSDALNVFYFVMKTGGDAAGNPKLGIKYSLDQGTEAKGKYNIPELASSVVAHPIDIAKLKLKPGNYDLKLEVKDVIGGTTLNRTIPLVIH